MVLISTPAVNHVASSERRVSSSDPWRHVSRGWID